LPDSETNCPKLNLNWLGSVKTRKSLNLHGKVIPPKKYQSAQMTLEQGIERAEAEKFPEVDTEDLPF